MTKTASTRSVRSRHAKSSGRRHDTDMYIHCPECVRERLRPNIAVGFSGGTHLQIWCETHDIDLGRYPLALSIPNLTCAECGRDEPHTH